MEKTGLPPLGLDFVPRARAWGGRALLAVAVLFAGDAGVSFARLKSGISEAQGRLERTAAAPSAGKVSPEEIAAARETVQRLSLPWVDLLTALESAASAQVALRAIEPDPKTGTVRITADSLDYPAALAYVRSLSAAATLSHVQLVRHEQKGNAVEFSVSAVWLRGGVRGRG